MRSTALVAPILFGFAVLASTPREADACSAPPCWSGSFSLRDGGTVPANVPGIVWRPISSTADEDAADPTKVVLATTTGTPLAMTVTQLDYRDYLLVPQQPLTPGATYTLTDGNTCGEMSWQTSGPHVTFTASAAAPLPTQLGAAALGGARRGELEVGTASGSCSVEVDAQQAEIDLVLDPSATAWGDVLQFETLVDGQRWYASSNINEAVPVGESWRGRAGDLVYRVCTQPQWGGAAEGLVAGQHEIKFRATLAGTSTVIESEPVSLSLLCDEEFEGDHADDGDGGCQATGTSSSPLALLALLALRRRRIP